MARSRPEKKRERNADEQLPLPTDRPASSTRVLPVQLRVGDRLTNATGEYEIIGRPYTTQLGKHVHVRVKRVDNAEVTMIRSYSAHERISVQHHSVPQ
jgi:hypothetical protein